MIPTREGGRERERASEPLTMILTREGEREREREREP
jgi:hypothetical protein